jgi:hypothetical protein
MFVFQFSCLGDWRKVIDEGPWIFRGNDVLIDEYDGITKPSTVKFKNLAIWARIYDLPTGFRTESIGHQIGNKIGKTLCVETDENMSGWRDYLRIRVKLDIEKPLTRVVYVSMGHNGKREVFHVKYEKLPKFCAVCGLLGHSDSEYGDGVHDKKAFQYGDWLIASPEGQWRVKGSRSIGSTDTKDSASRDSSKGNFPMEGTNNARRGSNRKNHVDDKTDVHDDDGISMERGIGRQLRIEENGSHKRLSLGYGEGQDDNHESMALIPFTSLSADAGNDTGEMASYVPQNMRDSSEFEKVRDPNGRGTKRLRKEGGIDASNGIDMRSAGSLEEYRWEK